MFSSFNTLFFLRGKRQAVKSRGSVLSLEMFFSKSSGRTHQDSSHFYPVKTKAVSKWLLFLCRIKVCNQPSYLFTQTTQNQPTQPTQNQPTQPPPTTHQPNQKKMRRNIHHSSMFFLSTSNAGRSSTLDGSSVQLWEKGMELMRMQAEGCHGTQLGVMFNQFFWAGGCVFFWGEGKDGSNHKVFFL